MKFIFKFLTIIVMVCSFSAYSVGSVIMKKDDEFKSCKAECYKQHEACIAVCNQYRSQDKNSGKQSGQQVSYNKCRYALENKKCMPELNTCVTTKCHPFFKA